jgi:superfamily I DNA/RNA helicase
MSLFVDDKGFNKPTVVLSSVHKAKGLEWNRVFLISKTFRVTKGEDEEANIYYVAVTRAKQELVFVSEDKPTDN